ncbi:hypothetical protein DWV63_01565 [Enterococcus durans]|nr:hypothetical protein DWV63_01565 [Enterococcus durans]
MAFEHRGLGCEKAALHQAIRMNREKQLFMFFICLGLLLKMQAFEHRGRGCERSVQLRANKN